LRPITPKNKTPWPSDSPSVSSQPIKGILKTPDRERYSDGKVSRSDGQNKTGKKDNKKKNQTPKISFMDRAKRGPDRC
jgi:hypothetical protein